MCVAMDFIKSKPLVTLFPFLGTIVKAFWVINAVDALVKFIMQS